MQQFMTPDHLWLALGFVGQLLFGSRFFVQLFKSEIEGRSVVPVAFWYFSIGGGLISFAYAIHIVSWPFIISQGAGLIPYFRNLWLILREQRALKEAAKAGAA